MVNAASEGKLKAIYAMGENPMLSDPDVTHVEEALKGVPGVAQVVVNLATEKAAVEFGKFLEDVEFRKPACKVVSNVTAELEDETNIREMLYRQMKSPVLWTTSVLFMRKAGVVNGVECGFGNVIRGLVKKIDREFTVTAWNQALGA